MAENITKASMNVTTAVLVRVNWYYSSRFWISFGVSGFILNILEAISIIDSKKHKTVFGLTLSSLCAADTLGSLCFIVAGALRLAKYDGTSTVAIAENSSFAVSWRAGHGALFFSVGSSFAHIVIIAVQRLFAVFLPIRFKLIFTYKLCALLLGITWLLFFLSGVIGFFYSQGLLLASYYLILTLGLILVISYSALCYKAYQDSKRRKLLSHSHKSSIEKTVSLSLAITLAFIFCTYLQPIFYLFVPHVEDLTLYHIVNCVICANPFLDAVIYFFFYHRCGKETKGLENKAASPAMTHKLTYAEEIPLRRELAKKHDKTSIPSVTI